jgi:hypothetical protein
VSEPVQLAAASALSQAEEKNCLELSPSDARIRLTYWKAGYSPGERPV